MKSQNEPSATQAPYAHMNPIDGSQHDHAMTSPSIQADGFGEPRTMYVDSTDREMAMEENNSPLHNDISNRAPAPVTTTCQSDSTVNNSNNLPVTSDYITYQEIEMGDVAPFRRESCANTSIASVLGPLPELPKHVDVRDHSMQVDSYIAAQEEIAGNHPTTSQVLQHSNYITHSTVTSASTFCNPNIGEGTVSAPKRRWSPSLVDELTDQMDASVPTDPQRDFVFSNMIDNLTQSWRNVLELYGMRLGYREAFHTNFVPDINAIQEKSMRRWAPLDEIADAIESAMLDQWAHCCRRVARKYQLDMRRDLVSEARATARKIKDQVLADAAQIRFLPPSEPNSPQAPMRLRIPSVPASQPHLFALPLRLPITPGTKKRPAPLDVEALRSDIAGLDLNGTNSNSNKKGLDTPRTPASAKRFKASPLDVTIPRRPLALPKGMTTPGRGRTGARLAVPPTPTRCSRRAQTPTPQMLDEDEDRDVDMETSVGYEIVGHIGPYPVREPQPPVGQVGFAVRDEVEVDAGADADVSGEGEGNGEKEDGVQDDDMDGGDDDVFITSH
ncbi:hypothetical protein F4805DRAFT_455186 [Annulohypoxylon moriforme]|nr:hypothetical protein F4805DRAFT_455186 [Annulohypoxylon moriforme]